MNELIRAPETVDLDPPRKEAFFDRWSRLKQEVRAGAVPPGTVESPAETPVLPSLETLAAQGLEADFAPFMQQGVAEATKRAAIQQLFKQPVFNVMDGLDVYIEDFNIYEPLTAAELPGLAHARAMLFPETEVETELSAAAVEAEPHTLCEAGDEVQNHLNEEETHGRG
ncbi:MAG: DUF3306 domain-containing protein [Rhodocyclaceae bacterium]|nr:DUF3306 domain-containing protein [Rhodocyclaceae bacterium]